MVVFGFSRTIPCTSTIRQRIGAETQSRPVSRHQEAEIYRLRTALEPFARKANAPSLAEALGHISREDLLRAQAALKNEK